MRVTRAAAVMAVGLRVTCCRGLKCLIGVLALTAGARMQVISSLRHLVSGSGCGFLAGTLMPMPAPVQPLSATVGSPGEAARYSAGRAWVRAAVMSWGEPGSTGAVHIGKLSCVRCKSRWRSVLPLSKSESVRCGEFYTTHGVRGGHLLVTIPELVISPAGETIWSS